MLRHMHVPVLINSIGLPVTQYGIACKCTPASIAQDAYPMQKEYMQ